jgi:hypothetical protein
MTLKPGKYTIPVVTRLQDNGDGGYTMYVYNNFEELLADHPRAKEFKNVNGKWQDVKVELTEEQKEEILTEDDPYKNGYIGKDNIEIEVNADGRILLAKSMSFHAGQ